MIVGIGRWPRSGFLDDYIKVRQAHNRGIFWKKKGYITLGLSLRSPSWWCRSRASAPVSVSPAPTARAGSSARSAGCIWAGSSSSRRQRRQRHRRPRRPRRRLGAPRLPRVHDHRLLGLPQPEDLRRPSSTRSTSRSSPSPLAGACVGFLWWNAAPARIIMGDVGALGLGTALALLALATNTRSCCCRSSAASTSSRSVRSPLQMGSYKLFNKRRLFRMSPIHHHFELLGWPETTVIIRFWIIAGICVAIGARPLLRRLRPSIGVADGVRRSSTAWRSPARPPPACCTHRGWSGHRRRRRVTERDAHVPPPSSASSWSRPRWRHRCGALVHGVDLVTPSPGRARAPPALRGGGRGRRARAHRDRPGLRVGAGPRRAARGPMLAVTGTDGKTTTTMHGDGDARGQRLARRRPSATPSSRWSPRSTPTSTPSSSSAAASG